MVGVLGPMINDCEITRKKTLKLLEIYKVLGMPNYCSTHMFWSPAKGFGGEERCCLLKSPGLSVLKELDLLSSLTLLSIDWLMGAGPGVTISF